MKKDYNNWYGRNILLSSEAIKDIQEWVEKEKIKAEKQVDKEIELMYTEFGGES